MSESAIYMAIVAKTLNISGLDALHIPLVLGNHAIAVYYDMEEVKYRFLAEPKITL